MGVIGAGSGTNTQGARVAATIGSTRKVPQYTNTFQDISADVSPLVALMEKFGINRKVKAQSFFHLETDKLPLYITVSDAGGLNDSDTSMGVSAGHGARVTIGAILKVLRTGEMIRVTNRSTDTLTITRGAGSTTAAAISDGEEIAILGFADTDGNTAPNGVSSEPTLKTNYTQIFRRAYEASGRNMATEVYGPEEWTRIRTDALEAMRREKEQTYLFSNGISSSDPTLTGGFEYWVTTNVTNAGGSDLDEGSWREWLRQWLRRNVGQKQLVVMAGELVTAALAGFGLDNVQYGPDDQLLGMSCGSYRSDDGTVVKIMKHALLSPIGSSVTAANYGWQGYAFGTNYGKCGQVTFRGLKEQKDIETPGTDGRKDGLLEDIGMQLVSEQHHAIYKGVTG